MAATYRSIAFLSSIGCKIYLREMGKVNKLLKMRVCYLALRNGMCAMSWDYNAYSPHLKIYLDL